MKKRILTLLLAITLALGVCTPAVFAGEDNAAVTIIHTTDAHGRTLGYAAIANLVKQHESAGENVLLLDSGDIFHGLPAANLERGGSIAPLLKAVGYDAVTTGNHDYNFGTDRLKELGEQAGTPILAANVVDEDGNLVFEDYKIWNFNGFKVGVFGIANDHTKTKTAPANTEGIEFRDDIETAKKMVDELEDQADYIVALTHIGSQIESEGTSIDLANEVKGIDLILDGHSHNTNDGIMVGETMLVSDGYYQESAGVVRVYSDKKEEFSRFSITGDTPGDEEIQALVVATDKAQSALLEEEVGETSVFLNAEYPFVRTQETYMGDLICDSYRLETGAQIAVENGGGIRASIPAGKITRGQVYEAFPFGNYIVTKEVTGADFIQILEDSVREVTEMGGSFLQISGAGYAYDAAKEPGKRIIGVTVAGQPIDPVATYTVATNNYVGTTFSKFADYPVLNEYCASDEALISCLAKGAVAFHDETPRITVLGGIGNGYRICIDAYLTENDVAPVVSGESVLLPFRAVFELSNYSVSWDGALQTATAAKDASTVSVCYSDGTVAIDGVPVDANVTMVQDRVLIDSAAIAQALNKAVYVDEFTNSIVLF